MEWFKRHRFIWLIVALLLQVVLVGVVAFLVSVWFLVFKGMDVGYTVGRIAGWIILGLSILRILYWSLEKKLGTEEA